MLNKIPKTAFIYHNRDADGVLSALLFGDAFIANHNLDNISEDKDNLHFFGYNYEPTLKFEKHLLEGDFDKIVFADCTPPKEWFYQNMKTFKAKKNIEIWVIDHHAPREKEIREYLEEMNVDNYINWLFDASKSASKIIWDSFYNTSDISLSRKMFNVDEKYSSYFTNCTESKNLPYLVEQVDAFDMWIWWENYVKYDDANPTIHYWGLYGLISDLQRSGTYADNKYQSDTIKNILFSTTFADFVDESISTIFDIGKKQYEQELNSAKSYKLIEKNGFVICGTQVSPFITKRIGEEFPDAQFALYFRLDERNDPEAFKLSFRSINENYDVANIAKVMFGSGGGHKTAAGSYSKITKFFEVVNTFDANDY